MENVSFMELKEFAEKYQRSMKIYAIIKNEEDVPVIYEKYNSYEDAKEMFKQLTRLTTKDDYILVELLPGWSID